MYRVGEKVKLCIDIDGIKRGTEGTVVHFKRSYPAVLTVSVGTIIKRHPSCFISKER